MSIYPREVVAPASLFVGSVSPAVCCNRRAKHHRVFQEVARRRNTSVG